MVEEEEDDGADTLHAVKRRARYIGTGCGWRSDEHQLSSVRWNTWAIVLTVTSAVFSGTAGATLFATAAEESSLAYVGGAVGVVAAVLVTVNMQLAPQTQAQRHSSAASAFSNQASLLFHLAYTATDHATALADLERLTVKRNELNDLSPRPEMWAVRKVKKQRARRPRAQRARGFEAPGPEQEKDTTEPSSSKAGE